MMTSRLAFSYNREVYALPGRIDDIRSQGCNYLIKNKIAEPITSIDGLIKSLRLSSSGINRAENMADKLSTTYSGKVSEDRISRMSTLLLAIRKERGISIDELCQHCNMDYNIVATLVRTLEADGFITIDLMQRCCILSRK